jgi:hypothetical protein
MEEDKNSGINKKLPPWVGPLLIIILVVVIFLVLELVAGSGGFQG